MKRVAVYARVSKDAQETENQLEQLRRFAALQGWEIVKEYVDSATGKNADRDEFGEMFVGASRRAFDLVLVWALDRLTREGVAETFIHIKRLADHGVKFVSFTEEHFRTTGPAGELMIAIAAWIAKQERIRLVERTTAGLERYKRDFEAGRAVSKSGKNLAAGRPRVIFSRPDAQRLRAEGISIRQIAAKLKVSKTTVARAVAK